MLKFSLGLLLLAISASTLTACSGEAQDPPTRIAPTAEAAEGQIVWPLLEKIEPSPAIVGETVTITGRAGYLQLETGYDESFRTFLLFLDGEEFGEIGCFVNRCEGEVVIPTTLDPGRYELSVEGGSTISIEIEEA